MIITHYQRGDGLVFTAAPVDENGDSVTPDSLTLNVNFLNTADEREQAEPITMEADTSGETWGASWTSRSIGAKSGRVYWSIETVNPDSAEEGCFDLDANLANQAD